MALALADHGAILVRVVEVMELRFRPIVIGICAAYACIAGVYAVRLPMIMDEFQGAYSVLQHAEGLPYRDFDPYKTVLGYYLQLLPISLLDDPWDRLVAVRLTMVGLNAGLLYLAASRLARHVARPALITALAMLVCMSTFLEHGAALRVDMLTSWAGLFALLALMDRRHVVAGALAGLSFLISQKGIYYLVAGGAALLIHWAGEPRDPARRREVLQFAGAALAPIGLYLLIFGALASFSGVFHRVFLAHTSIALDELYDIRTFWFQTLGRNPLFYGLAVLGLGGLLARRDATSPQGIRDQLLFTWSATLLVLCALHRQPWPYFFVILIPTCFVLVASLLDSELRRPRGIGPVLGGAVLVLGIASPLLDRIPAALARDSAPQRDSVRLAERLLGPDDAYLAGLAMVNTRTHVDQDRLGWLDRRHLDAARALDHRKVIATLDSSRLKVLIWNYRLDRLPARLRTYLQRTYARVQGNVYLYGPTFPAGVRWCRVRFEATYSPRSRDGSPVVIGGRLIPDRVPVSLPVGSHMCAARSEFQLVPVVPGLDLDPEVRQAQLFSGHYTF